MKSFAQTPTIDNVSWRIGPTTKARLTTSSSEYSFHNPPAFRLQRKANCACGGGCPRCQSKAAGLPVSQPTDAAEVEADRVAEQVMRMPSNQSSSLNQPDSTPKTLAQSIAPVIQTKSEGVGEMAGAAFESMFSSLPGNGGKMDQSTRRFMESRFGTDFNGIRIHADVRAAQLAREVNAEAFTVGNDVYFAGGKYVPESDTGKRLLAHELTHTLQQSRRGNTHSSPVGVVQRQNKSSKCTDAEVTTLNQQMHAQCDKPRSCSMQGDSCATATAKVGAGNACVDQRTKLQQKCFSPGDLNYETHMERIAQDSAALRNCITVMTVKCALEAAAAAAVAAALLALKNAGKQGLKRFATKALVYAEVAAAVILLASGKAEAKISLEGESPLEALFKAMEQDGVPVSDDLKKLIESDPELKKMLEESVKKSGNLSDAQKEIAKRYAEHVNQHLDEFSKEELQTIMTTTDQVADKMPASVNVEGLKKALKDKADKKSGEKQEGGEGTSPGDTPKPPTDVPTPTPGDKGSASQTGGTTPQTGKPTTPPDTDAPKYKALNDENKKRIKDAPQAVAKLFREFVAGQKGDVKVDDATVKQFFEIVPTDLTDQQADALIAGLVSSEGMTPAAILEALKKAVAEVRKDPTQTSEGTATGPAAAEQNQPGKSRDEIIAELKAMAAKTDFSKIPEGQYRIRNIQEKVEDTKLTAHVYGKVKGIGVVGYIIGTIPEGTDMTKLKPGDSFVVTIISQSPFVDKKGVVHNFRLGNSITIVK